MSDEMIPIHNMIFTIRGKKVMLDSEKETKQIGFTAN